DTGGIVQFNQEKWMKRKKVFSTGTDILLPILKGEGIRKIDKLIFTHGDYDHIGGAYEVLQLFPVENLLIGDKLNFGKVEQERIELAIKKGTNIQKVSEGFIWKVEDNNFQVLSPIKGYVGEENHGSIVMKAKIGDKVWMFTGDVDKSGEQSIISKYRNVKSDVLKVGHHGSDTSTSDAFVRAVDPKFAIISVGANNRYGHPKKEVIDRLQKEKIIILRTDRDGAIFYEFKKGQGTFSTFKAYRKSRDRNPKEK
ncbi:ComEC/Rec2 family competence protein, partial [Bacillus sp. JJ664]